MKKKSPKRSAKTGETEPKKDCEKGIRITWTTDKKEP